VAPTVYSLPDGQAIRLDLEPRLDSWERRGHPAQVRLSAFVEHVLARIGPPMKRIDGPLALRLDIGLPADVDPLWERDLDNYLYPIARELPARVVSYWATKGRAPHSSVRLEPAPVASIPDWPGYPVPRAAGSETSWKLAVRAAVAPAQVLAAGPVGVQVAFTIGPQRSWASMWKRTIDALDPLLGRANPSRDWNPLDGRIVRLGLHRTTDPSLGHDAEATIWARTAASRWPELAWLTDMTEAERRAYAAEHDRRTLRSRRTDESPTVRPASGTTARGAGVLPDGVVALGSAQEFADAVTAGAAILITHVAGPPKLHVRPRECRWVTSENFVAKVVTGGGRNGRYYRVEDLSAAATRWPRLTHCAVCGA
jgi:hypothetical protein